MDPAVTFLLQTLRDEIVTTSKKLSSVRSQISNLRDDLSYYKSVLEIWTENPIEDKAKKDWVKQLREAMYEAEDILADFIAEQQVYKSKSPLSKLTRSLDHPKKLLSVVKKIEVLKDKLEKMKARKNVDTNAKQDGQGSLIGPRLKMDPKVEEENVVGFDDEAKNVISLLTQGSDDLEVITIIGMPGLGKTTLAKMIFRDPKIEYEFYNRVWVYVSKDCNIREVFIHILGHFAKVTIDMHEMSDKDLVKELHRHLERDKYLIVMDDVWERTDWDALQVAFPKNKKKSRILITSRHEYVATHANQRKGPHRLKFLTQDESCMLLSIKALGSEECPSDLVTPRNHIARECGGLPLAIVVIGGILREKGTSRWIDISRNVKDYINMDRDHNMDKLIAWSFYELPYSLKACFLYFGMFPEDSQISVRKLIRMWIAEGFIEQKPGVTMSLENIAEEYLEDLVNRNLVIVGKLRSNGKIKTCHVHDMIRAFCIKIAAEENLYHEVKTFDSSTYPSLNPEFETYRRLSIHSRVWDYLNSKNLIGPQIRSFSCSSSEEITLQNAQVYCIPKAFKLLRVLDGKPLAFQTYPRDISTLVHLKYLVLSIKFRTLPDSFSNLWSLQSLIVHTTSRTLEIRGDTLRMLRLRHLQTNASTSWLALSKEKSKKEDLVKNGNLTTLSTISPETCTTDAFSRVPSINKLGIRGQLAKILNGRDRLCSLDHLTTLRSLENLKLINDVLDVSNSESQIVRLPDRFPPYVKKLTLTNTQLDWLEMSTLGKLEKLEILKLKENAFKGQYWDTKEGEFRVLKVLHIGRTDLNLWQTSGNHFPSLKRLSLSHCTYLKDFPSDVASFCSLQTVELFWTTTVAAASAKRIHKKLNESTRFKLSIYPPDHDQ